MKIDEAHRGKGIGSLALPVFMHAAAKGAAITVVNPYPIELRRERDGKLPPSELAKVDRTRRSLRRFYRRVGFMPLGRSPFMYHENTWALHLPDGSDL